MEFIERQTGWKFSHEYVEKGVSGYKVSAEKRDELQLALRDAEKGKFDVLLVFMFDRLGRIESETPLITQLFVERGVEMWSVKEGQQKFEEHTDSLINYIRFWQAGGESKKISMRVDEKHRQMVEDGVYRGGSVPYGYMTVKSGVFTKKGVERKKVIIDEKQAEVVNWMYDLVVQEGYGQNRIAKLLNDKGILTSKGKQWSASSVSVVLRNPMYKGFYVYARGTNKEVVSEEVITDWVIVDEEKWDRVQEIRSKRNPKNMKENPFVVRTTKGKLLFVGMIRCGHCGGTLTTTYNTKYYTRKDGTIRASVYAKYRCGNKAHNKVKCDGQTIYAQKKIEGIVLDEINGYLDRLKTVDLTKQIQEIKKQNTASERLEVTKLKRKLDEARTELTALRKEVTKSLLGKSYYTTELLSSLIDEKEIEVTKLENVVALAEGELENKKIEYQQMKMLQKYIPKWRNVFEKASIEKKKMMLSTIIGGIIVRKDKIEIDFRLHIGQFVDSMGDQKGLEKGAINKDAFRKILTFSSLSPNK